MTLIDRRPERKLCRERLCAIEDKVRALGYGFFSTADVESTGIQLGALSLEDKSLWPRFFEPYKGDILIQDEHYLKSGPMYLDDEFLQSNAGTGVHCVEELACHGVFPQREEFPPGPRYRDLGDFTNFGLLLENQAPRWQVEVVWDAANGQHPHLKVMVIHDTDGKDADQRLLRAELLTLITIIKARLTHKATRAYADAPVLLFSFLDSRVRVMEANFDGKHLNIRFSRLYDFRIEAEEQCSLVVFLTKWWMGQSINTGLV